MIFQDLIEWTKAKFLPYDFFGLFVLAFIEASFFPVPPDVLLILLCLLNKNLFLFYALITTIGSVLGGVLGYGIGYLGEHYILEKLFSKKKIEKVHRLFDKYEAWAIFIAGFTPVPYKVFTIAAGVFYVNIKKFILFSFLSRGLRFFLEAFLIFLFGDLILFLLENYFDILTFFGVLVLIVIYVFYVRFYKK